MYLTRVWSEQSFNGVKKAALTTRVWVLAVFVATRSRHAHTVNACHFLIKCLNMISQFAPAMMSGDIPMISPPRRASIVISLASLIAKLLASQTVATNSTISAIDPL